MKTAHRFKRKVRALKAQKLGLLRELFALQARYNQLETVRAPARASVRK